MAAGNTALKTVEPEELNEKQLLFCIEYIKDFNAKQAAIRAGYTVRSAEVTGCRLLSHDKVAAKIRSIQSKYENKVIVSREKVLAQYAKLAFYDIRKFYDENGKLKRVIDLDEDTAAALAGVEVEEETTTTDNPDDIIGDAPIVDIKTSTKKIKLSDMKGALDSICKMEGYNMPDKMLSYGKIETVVRYQRAEDNHNPPEETA